MVTMSRWKSFLVAAAFVALAAVVVWQEARARRLLRDAAAAEREEHKGLAAQLQSAAARADTNALELARLRNQSARSRQLEQENARLKAEMARLSTRTARAGSGAEDELSPEQRLQRAKG